MKNRKLAASVSLVLLAGSPAILSAEDCCMPEYTPGEPLCDPCAGYSEYAGVQLDCGWDVFAYGEFLYWKPLPNLSFVAEEVPASAFAQPPPLPVGPQKMLAFKEGYRPGFRVGLGMVAHCFDDWIFNIDYFRYHHAFTQTMSPTSTNILISLLNSFPASQIKNRSHFHYDIVGLNMQRPNYLGRRVVLSPFLGLKWLKRNVEFSQVQTALQPGFNLAKSTIKYTSVGLAAGFDGSWLLCWGLSIIGTADVALLYPYQRSSLQVLTSVPDNAPSTATITKGHIKHLDIYAKGGVGVGWGSYFCCRRYHFNLRALFDFSNDVIKMDAFTGITGNSSVAMMGLSVRGQFDF